MRREAGELQNEVDRHYLAVLGEPSRRAQFQIKGHSSEVVKWDAEANPFGVALYLSLGSSRTPMPEMEESHRVEFFIGLLPEQDDVARGLTMVALDAALHRSTLGAEQTVTYPEPLWDGTEMHSFLVLRPIVEMIPEYVCDDGLHVEFLQLVPLFAGELAFKARFGAQALMGEFERAQVPFWDPDRKPLSLGGITAF